MNILIDIGHPGHVHLLKNLYFELARKRHNIWVTVKDIPAAKELLKKYNIEYLDIGKKKDGVIGKGLYQIYYNLRLLNLVWKHKINIGIGSSISIAHVSKLSKIKSIILDDDDDDVQPLFVKYAHPFCDILLSPDSLKGHRKKKCVVYYPGYHELAYLHPNVFKPDVSILDAVGVQQGEPFFIMRFNAFKAHHDVGVKGLTLEQKMLLIRMLKTKGKVFITTEREIEPELKQYQITISPEKIHHLMFFATLFLGDSQTMTSEAAVLGTPAIRNNSLVGKIAYLNEEEFKYGLTYGFLPSQMNDMINKINELLNMQNLKQEWEEKRQRMLIDRIDVTKFLVWFVENYPESKSIMQKDPNYSLRFR